MLLKTKFTFNYQEKTMANGITKGNRPSLGSSLEALNASNPLNSRSGKETVSKTQDYKKGMKSAEELDDLR